MIAPRATSAPSWLTEAELRRGVTLRSAFPYLLSTQLAVDFRHCGEAGALVDFLAVDIEFHHLVLEASGIDMIGASSKSSRRSSAGGRTRR